MNKNNSSLIRGEKSETQVLIDPLHGLQTGLDEIIEFKADILDLFDILPSGSPSETLLLISPLHEGQIHFSQFFGGMHESSRYDQTCKGIDGCKLYVPGAKHPL